MVYLDWVAGINRGSQTAAPTGYSLTLPRESLAKYKSLGTTESDLQAYGVHLTDIGLGHIKDAVLALAKRQRQTWRVRTW